jgi:hypothetical protein
MQSLRHVKARWIIFAVSGLGILSAVALESLPDSATTANVRGLLRLLATLAAAVPGLYGLLRAEGRAESAARQAQEAEAESKWNLAYNTVKSALIAAIPYLFPKEDPGNIRANIMVEDEGLLSPYVFTDLMRLDGDSNVAWRKGEGCCGAAWQQALVPPIGDQWRPVIAPTIKANTARTRWGLTSDQLRQTRHVKWVVSVPMFYAETGVSTFVGILNFHGIAALRNSGRLDENDFLGTAARLATSLAQMLVEEELVAFELG